MYYAIIFGILNYVIIIYLILTFARYSPHDVKFVFQFFIDFLINSTIFSDTLIPLIQGFPKSRNRESYHIIIIITIIIRLSALLLVAPVYSARADNNLLSKVSQSLAQ